ncbi:hypothetical protein B0F90DRAFT_1666204 [Multifurca ochricompacta]|uniref:Uncharacterized protein n=1 Tax=Multifurca ochricompacta TaxID=376703 RepID=A0AAD4MA50_9AGAM|nr:hypothetical protein B0F90DRAFT_1666204 [Multifurca ochricompacta]
MPSGGGFEDQPRVARLQFDTNGSGPTETGWHSIGHGKTTDLLRTRYTAANGERRLVVLWAADSFLQLNYFASTGLRVSKGENLTARTYLHILYHALVTRASSPDLASDKNAFQWFKNTFEPGTRLPPESVLSESRREGQIDKLGIRFKHYKMHGPKNQYPKPKFKGVSVYTMVNKLGKVQL